MSSFRHRPSKRRGKSSAQANGRSSRLNAQANGSRSSAANAPRSPSKNPAAHEVFMPKFTWLVCLAATLLAAAFAWSYWPAFGDLFYAWEHEPDYSHGYLVVPVALWFLWLRREDFPGLRKTWAWPGLALIALASLLRYAGSLWYVDVVQIWSIPLWLAGVCWLVGGWRLLRWASPAVLFLCFMIPLPFRAERILSLPLQGVATRLSCWALQTIGEPAFAEGHAIIIGNQAEPVRLEIAEACSGLRIFMSIAALAFAYVVVMQKPWWTKLAVVCSVLPVALLTNALRIVITGVLHAHVSGEAAHRFSHDAAGWAMIPMAAAMMGVVVWYVGRLIVEVKTVSAGELLSAGFRVGGEREPT